MDENLGDRILKEYMKKTSKPELLKKLDITESIYESWLRINRAQLKKIDLYIEQQHLKSKLKIRNLPEINFDSSEDSDTDSDTNNRFLRKEPGPEHSTTTIPSSSDKRTTILTHRKSKIQKKINQLIDLESEGKIGQNEYNKAMDMLRDEMENVNRRLLER